MTENVFRLYGSSHHGHTSNKAGPDLKSGGGGGNSGGMDERINKLTIAFTRMEARFDGVDQRLASIEKRFDDIDRRLDRIENRIPSKWDMAQVVFFVVGALMAAAIFGPRLTAMLPAAPT